MSGIDPEYRSRTPGSRPIRARVIVASNRAAAGVYTDTSGPLLAEGLTELGYQVDPVVVAVDRLDSISPNSVLFLVPEIPSIVPATHQVAVGER